MAIHHVMLAAVLALVLGTGARTMHDKTNMVAEGGSPGLVTSDPGLPPSVATEANAHPRERLDETANSAWPFGLTQQLLDDPRLQDATTVESITSLTGGRVMAIFHVNPTTQAAVIVAADHRTYQVYRGNTFTWDSAQRHLAWLVDADNGGAGPATELWMDGKFIERQAVDNADAQISWARTSAAPALVASAN